MKLSFKLFIFAFFILIYKNSSASSFYLQPEFGLSWGAITQNRTAQTVGLKGGVNIGYRWGDALVPVVELQYHRFSTQAIENESIELQSFPIGGGLKYIINDQLYLSYAFYFDNALYKNLTLFPLVYSYVFESNNSWRFGVGYNLKNSWSVLVHYEKYFVNKIKYKQPISTTADLVTAIEMHFINLTLGYLF